MKILHKIKLWLKQRKREKLRLMYIRNFGLNEERDLSFLRAVVMKKGTSYLRRIDLIAAATGKGHRIGEKIVAADMQKLLNDTKELLSESYKEILYLYFKDEVALSVFISDLFDVIELGIISTNKTKMDAMGKK